MVIERDFHAIPVKLTGYVLNVTQSTQVTNYTEIIIYFIVSNYFNFINRHKP